MTEAGTQAVMLDELIDEIDEDMVPVVFESFLEDTAGMLEQMELSISEKKADTLRKQAHRIKGCLTSVRAHIASALAKKLESCADAADFTQADALMPHMKTEFERTLEFIKQYMQEHA